MQQSEYCCASRFPKLDNTLFTFIKDDRNFKFKKKIYKFPYC